MRLRGLEPPRAQAHTDLNRARLPIPPQPPGDPIRLATDERPTRPGRRRHTAGDGETEREGSARRTRGPGRVAGDARARGRRARRAAAPPVGPRGAIRPWPP